LGVSALGSPVFKKQFGRRRAVRYIFCARASRKRMPLPSLTQAFPKISKIRSLLFGTSNTTIWVSKHGLQRQENQKNNKNALKIILYLRAAMKTAYYYG